MGGGAGSFEMGRPAEVRPVTFEMGVNIYSGPQSSLAGSLPSWVSWFSANLEYELGALVHFNGVVNVYKHTGLDASHENGPIPAREDYITQVEYNTLDPDGKDEYTLMSNTSIVKRSLFETELEGMKLGTTMPIGDSLPQIMTYFDYRKETIFVCTEDGASMSAADFNNPIIRKDYSTERFMAMIKRNNIVVKTMADQIPFDYPERESNSSSMKFFSEIIPFFDKIILLDRKDVKSQLESYTRMVEQRSKDSEVLWIQRRYALLHTSKRNKE